MIEGWVLWLFLVGLAVGSVATGLLMWRLPRGEADVSDAERPAEAAWISAVIEHHGGVAPRSLVEEVLDLHQAYLQRSPPQAGWPDTDATVPGGLPAGYTPMAGYRPMAGYSPATGDTPMAGHSPATGYRPMPDPAARLPYAPEGQPPVPGPAPWLPPPAESPPSDPVAHPAQLPSRGRGGQRPG